MQVHPDDRQAALLEPADLGKTEAWVVLAAEPGSYLYAGLRRGFDRAALERELSRGTCHLCVERIEPRPGDCIFLPAGVVHALGPGLLVAEIQQSSDTTYRLFDWNRVGPDGQPRPLHISEALGVIDYDRGPIRAIEPRPILPAGTGQFHERLVECDKFILDRWQFDAPQTVGGDNRCHIVVVLEGAVSLAGDPAGSPLILGQTALVPAACGALSITPLGRSTLLDVFLP
jgi:mannose-6-phosphate isomerase